MSRTQSHRARASAATACLLVVLAATDAQPSHAQPSTSAATSTCATTTADVCEVNCEVVSFPVEASADRVDPFVPDEFTLRVVNGQATVVVGGVACEAVTVNGKVTAPYHHVYVRADIEYPGSDPDLDDRLSNVFWFTFATDNADVAAYFRKAGDLAGGSVALVKDISFIRDPATGTVALEAPTPAPSPFRITATTGQRVPLGEFRLNHWAPARHGLMAIKDDFAGDLRAGPSTGNLEILDPTSDLALMLCPEDGRNVPVFDAFADAHFADSAYSVRVEPTPLSQTTRPGRCP